MTVTKYDKDCCLVTLSDGREFVIPSSVTFEAHRCGPQDDACTAVHLIGYNDDGEPLCEIALELEQLQRLMLILAPTTHRN